MGTTPEFGSDTSFSFDPNAVERFRVVFVCFGNACRSQMAEGFLRHKQIDWLEALSAGIHPLGFIPPETVEAMQEKGVSLDGQVSKGLDAIDWDQVNLLVNMSSLPSGSVAPGYSGRREEWDIPDPFQFPLEEHRAVRDMLEERVDGLVRRLKAPSGGEPPEPVSA